MVPELRGLAVHSWLYKETLMAAHEQKALDLFGEELMHQVRDTQIRLWDETFAGTARSSTYKNIYKKLSQSFNEEQLAVLGYLTPWVVDNVIAYLLGMLENEHEAIHISVDADGQTVPSLYAISDGLEGELYAEDGWIARFSKERPPDEAYFSGEPPLG